MDQTTSSPAADAGFELRSLTVPARYVPGFRALATMSPQAFEQLRATLADVGPSPYGPTVARRVQSAHSDGAAIRSVVLSLISAEALRQQQRMTAPAAAASLAAAEGLDLPPDERATLRERLAPLLDIRSLAVSVKAASLTESDAHVFLRASVAPSIRPILGEGDLPTSVDAVVVHKLTIEYHDSPSHEDRIFLVALDSGDLARLRDAIQQALDESVKVNALMARASMVDVGEGSNDD